MAQVIRNLNPSKLALRTIQAPDQVVWDSRRDRWRVSSACFEPQSDGTISVDLQEAQERDGHPLTHGYPRVARAVGLVSHEVDRLQTDGLIVAHAPIPGNDYHGEATGKPTRSQRRKLAENCTCVVPLDGDEAQRQVDLKLAQEAQASSS